MKWVTNRDEALELRIEGKCIAAIWRGAWESPTGTRHDARGKLVQDGYLAATWHPYKRVGRFLTVKEAKAAVESKVQR